MSSYLKQNAFIGVWLHEIKTPYLMRDFWP